MVTQVIWDKIKFQLRAKGRHGTHSPFVYAFVEQVLRSKKHYGFCPDTLRNKDWDLLCSTINYLQPQEIILYSDTLSNAVQDCISGDIKIATSIEEHNLIGDGSDILIAGEWNDISQTFSIKNFNNLIKARISIYVLKSGRNVMEIKTFASAYGFKMVMDFWSGILLVKSNSFKEEQFFELK